MKTRLVLVAGLVFAFSTVLSSACTPRDDSDDDDDSTPNTVTDGAYDASAAAIMSNTCAPNFTAADINSTTVTVTTTANGLSWDTPGTGVEIESTRAGNSLSYNGTVILDFNEFQVDCVITLDVSISAIVTAENTIRVNSTVESITDASGADCAGLLAELGNPTLPCEIEYSYTLGYADTSGPTPTPTPSASHGIF